jgi:hypothetical protein
MFNVPLTAGVPGFRVGLPVDDDNPVRRPLSVAPSTAAFGYDPYGNVLQTTAPTAFRPAGTPHRAYVPVAGGWPSQDPSRQPSDRPANSTPITAEIRIRPSARRRPLKQSAA